MRVGMGYDVHRLLKDRSLIIGGVDIEHTKGLFGHSDADVLLHALMDALLGAANLGDIGTYFPDTDPQYKDISSRKLLAEVGKMIDEAHFTIGNIDATVVAQRPKLAPYIDQMKDNIAETLGIEKSRVSVKATTTEHLGFTGREEGMAAYAVCLLEETE